jgi:hypothetical protein
VIDRYVTLERQEPTSMRRPGISLAVRTPFDEWGDVDAGFAGNVRFLLDAVLREGVPA